MDIVAPHPRYRLRSPAEYLEAAVFDFCAFVLRLLPVDLTSAVFGALLRGLGPLTPAHPRVWRNLALAFPELSARARRAIARDQWENVGRQFAEFMVIDRLARDPDRVRIIGRENLAAAEQSGTGAIFVSGHFANWEVMAAPAFSSTLNCTFVQSSTGNPLMDRRYARLRAGAGAVRLAQSGAGGARQVMGALATGNAVAFLADLHARRGLRSTFFGHPVQTSDVAVKLALKHDRTIHPVSIQRLKGVRFRIEFHPSLRLEVSGDRARDLLAGVNQVNAFVEAQIRRRPADWLWLQNRWHES